MHQKIRKDHVKMNQNMCKSHMLRTTNIDEDNHYIYLRIREMYHDHGLEDSIL